MRVEDSDHRWGDRGGGLSSEGNGYWSIDVDGARAGDQYAFLLTSRTGEVLRKADARARAVTSSIGNAIVYAGDAYSWGDEPFTTPSWNTAVIYELHVGTFTSSGNGPGTLRSAIQRLDHVRDLGANVVEILPVGEFGGFRSKGYNTMLPFAVESDYGGPDALKDFVREAHNRGLAVILDLIYNHFGAADLERSLWRYDGWSENGYGGIYFYNDWREATPWQSPRPDYGRPEVQDFIGDNALMWLEEFHLDGLRLDQTAQMWSASGQRIPDGLRLLQRISDTVRWRQPWKILIAEDFAGGDQITEATSRGGAGFDAQWDPFVHDVRSVLTPVWDEERDLDRIARALTTSSSAGNYARVIYTESHDETGNGRQRLPEEISPGAADSRSAKKRSTLGAALVLTAPGIPMLFQGQEFLEDQWWSDERALDWSKRTTRWGILALYRDLVHLRRNWFDTTRGLSGDGMHLHHLDDTGKLVAFHRWDRGGPRDDVVVVANFGVHAHQSYRIGLPRGGRWRVRFNSDYIGYDFGFGNVPGLDSDADPIRWDDMPASAEIGIGGYSALILSQDE